MLSSRSSRRSGKPGPPVRIAVLDSGWSGRCRDDRVGVGWDATRYPGDTSLSSDVSDLTGHGTLCSEAILAYAGECEIIPVRIFHSTGFTSVTALVEGLRWTANQNIDLVSISALTSATSARTTLQEMCTPIRDSGALVVAATRPDGHGWPGALASVISVALVDPAASQRATSDTQSRADVLIQPAALAPILRLLPAGAVASNSLATAVVTGVLARLKRDGRVADNEQAIEQVRQLCEAPNASNLLDRVLTQSGAELDLCPSLGIANR